MKTVCYRLYIVMLVFIAFSIGVDKTTAQSSQQPQYPNMWGVYAFVDIKNGIVFPATTVLGLYPNGFVEYFYEGAAKGTYQLNGSQLILTGERKHGETISYTETFTLQGDSLLTNRGILFSKYSSFTGVIAPPCPNAVPSFMQVGLVGQVTHTEDQQPTRLRDIPSTNDSTIITKMFDSAMIVVIDGPECGEDYTWWKVWYLEEDKIGWAAEGNSEKYFISPDVYPDLINIETNGFNKVDQSYKCGSTLPTNLYVGATAEIGFSSSQYQFPLFTEALQTAGINGSLENGTSVTVISGPACSDNAIWWEISANGLTGWSPEVTTYSRYLLRTTSDPNDKSAIFDPLLKYKDSPDIWIEPLIPLKVYSSPDNSSAPFMNIFPGEVYPATTYEFGGYNASRGMISVWPSDAIAWICANPGYIRSNHPLQNVQIFDNTTYSCNSQDSQVTVENELKSLAEKTGSTYYPPGQFEHMQQLASAIASGELGKKTGAFVGLVVNSALVVKKVIMEGDISPSGGVEIVCFRMDYVELFGGELSSEELSITQQYPFGCLALDTKEIAEINPKAAGLYAVTQILLNPIDYVDPVLEGLYDRLGTISPTNIFCKFRPDICQGQ